MTTATAKKPAARKPAAPKPQPAKAAAPKEQKPAAKPAPVKAKPEPKPEPKTLVEALNTGQATLLKMRANGTKRSLPYLAVGTEGRMQAEAVAKMREEGQTVDAIAEALKVSTATARRFITNLALAHAVEAGDHDGSLMGAVLVGARTARASTLNRSIGGVSGLRSVRHRAKN